jgi:C-terminal processing protease CtpA/Prc
MITDVTTDSAASTAGLAADEEILAVNGRAVRHISIDELREQFKAPVGTQISLLIKSRAGRRSVTITLAELLSSEARG